MPQALEDQLLQEALEMSMRDEDDAPPMGTPAAAPAAGAGAGADTAGVPQGTAHTHRAALR